MTQWFLFGMLLVVGLGMVVAGILYMRKERDNPQSVKMYRTIAIAGVILTIGALIYKFVLS